MTELIRALIDTTALRHNLEVLRLAAGGAKVMAVVKANAYGHGLTQVAQALRAYERDSQAGTVLARDNPAQGNQLRLTDDQHASIERILRRHPVIKGNDFQPPNLLRL